MCSILGIINFKDTTLDIAQEVLNEMNKTMGHRGPDQNGFFRNNYVCFLHNRLSVIDVENGLQPMTVNFEGKVYTIIYNGEIYNADDLRKELISCGVHFKTHCDTEVVVYSYAVWGKNCSEKLNGIYAFAIYDASKEQVYLSRDRMGVKPFFYTMLGNTLIFASEIKAILKHPQINAEIDSEGIWQLLYLSPMRPFNNGIFKNILEISPGYHGTFDINGLNLYKYWTLKAYILEDKENDIIEKTRFLLTDAIHKQLVSDVPLCTFLSGGLDSSVITSVAKSKKQNSACNSNDGESSHCSPENESILSSYSFEYEGNKTHFTQTSFQPESDDDYAVWLANYLGTKHTVLTAGQQKIADLLQTAVKARDLPGMADIDSSLLFYCSEVKKRHTVALSGECSDEIFGGYPWFYRAEMLNRDFFPWIHDPESRVFFFNSDFAKPKQGLDFVKQMYLDSKNECPLIKSESQSMRTSRIATWLSVKWFMSSLLERKDTKENQILNIISICSSVMITSFIKVLAMFFFCSVL
ncbi:asparagine synthase (glutamine-hydrolysing) [Ruminiclostridium sufflavum DSM 19573]|uniref:asparagine synthase (glutamine-hydrolyzing) n=1 Tax=Ruminiclostridium sufflavum DSM 19573 TaxID=1121337 RepID=A0A318XJY0_9FIRM|nr:asparagine synthase (glutamine-hydrolyzing) [Ruminiclostridium sufflavum]PYG86653.1 asparagine synthase (glutamine-hydrolysing) [Ruminiclostridium sufflavum DSM 19573]